MKGVDVESLYTLILRTLRIKKPISLDRAQNIEMQLKHKREVKRVFDNSCQVSHWKIHIIKSEPRTCQQLVEKKTTFSQIG